MLRRCLRAVLVIELVALVGLGCAGRSPALRLRPQQLQPVELSREEFVAGMRMLAPAVRQLKVERPRGPQVRLMAAEPSELQMAAEYVEWCERVYRARSDCLGILGPEGVLGAQARTSLAFEFALSGALQEAAAALGSITPEQVRAMLSLTIGAMMIGLVAPEPFTKALALVASANLVAYLGVELFNNVVKGYLLMSEEAAAARDFGELRRAGDRYAARLGISVARVMTLVASYGIARVAGIGPQTMQGLPGGGRAAALAESQGFQLSWIDGLSSASLAADGSLTMTFAAGVAMAVVKPPSGGSTSTSGFDTNEEPSPEKLAANMLGPKGEKPEGTATHHIVAGKAREADEARGVLKKFKIGINDAPNGAFLPCNSRTPCTASGEVHASLHTRAYYKEVNRRLSLARTREEALQILDGIRQDLVAGRFSH